MIHRFNAPFVFYTEVENHSKIKENLLPTIKEDLNPSLYSNRSDGNKLYTTYNEGFRSIPDEMLDDIILRPFQKLVKEFQFSPPIRHIDLKYVWWNYYLEGGFSDPHSHREDDFSFIYLLHLTEKNTTVFRPMTDDCYRYPMKNLPYSTEHITEGNVIIFPSFLTHWARPCNNERAVIVGNMTVKC